MKSYKSSVLSGVLTAQFKYKKKKKKYFPNHHQYNVWWKFENQGTVFLLLELQLFLKNPEILI